MAGNLTLPGKIIAKEEFFEMEAFVIKNTGERKELNVLSREDNILYTEGDLIIQVPFSNSDILTFPPSDIDDILGMDNYEKIKGRTCKNNVAYCYNCATPERGDILSIANSHDFYIHEECLRKIRQTVEKLLNKNQSELVISELDS